MNEYPCHMCGRMTDLRCEHCDEPVCEECCVPFTIHNQIDFALCQCCRDGDEARECLRRGREDEIQRAKDEKLELRREVARKRYWKPENVLKRKERREARKKAKMELRAEQMARTVNMVSEMFRGMV